MCEKTDECLAEKLRQENYDQFIILVRMHLSFVLDVHTDNNEAFSDKAKTKKWSLAPFRKSKSKYVPETAPLTKESISQVYKLIEFIRKEPNICKEGVFRRTGSLNRQHDLKILLSQGSPLALEGGPYSVHDCASVLKGFLAELSEPLLTEAHYPAYCQIAELCGVVEKPTNEERLLQALQLLLQLLPEDNRKLLKDVLELLHLTASYEGHNKMSADSLATLFTPHLLCPRKLSPESLHSNSQTLSGIVSFMIKSAAKVLDIPPNLAVDIKAYLQEQARRKATSPMLRFDESVSDNFAANTVFSFVDVERTAKENQSNPTETALAQLYAHIQSLPESSRKRKLVKQFNKESGHGTPMLQSSTSKNKSFGDTIKKHIFHKGLIRSVKKQTGFVQLRSSSEEILNSPSTSSIKGRLFCTKCDNSDLSTDESLAKKMRNLSTENLGTLEESPRRSLSEPDLSTDDTSRFCSGYLTSTPACPPKRENLDLVFTPEDQGRTSMSPITRSTQRMCRAMQETMMTPRSRKPVLLVSGTNINNLATIEKPATITSLVTQMENLVEEPSTSDNSSMQDTVGSYTSLTCDFREYMHSRSMLTASPTDFSFSSRTDDYNSTDVKDVSPSKMSTSLLQCLDGQVPEENKQNSCAIEETQEVESGDNSYDDGEKKLVLKPNQFDENGKPTVYETSF